MLKVIQNKNIRICIHSGEIPSTLFIERLIEGLAKENIHILLTGYIKKRKQYPKNIKVRGYTVKWSKLWLFLRMRILFLFRKSDWKKLKSIRQQNKNLNTLSKKLNWHIKTMPIIWYKPDVFHLQWVKNIDDWMFLQKFNIKIVTSLRGAQINYSPIASPEVKNNYLKTFPKIDGFHCVSKAICVEGNKYGANNDRCKVVYSGLDLSYLTYKTRKNNSENNNEISLLSVGRPHWKKGYMYAIDACNILKKQGLNFKYEIIGGAYEEHLFQIHQLNLTKHITLREKLPFEKVMKKIQDIDLLLLPSIEEGIANVVLEAMALGTPVISTDCEGMKEVIKDGVNGWLIPIRDPKAIANKITEISKLPIEEINTITQNARNYIEKIHAKDQMVSEMIDFYNQVLYKKD